MSNIIIKAENISKSFVISHETKARYNSLGESVSEYAKRLLRKSKQVSASTTMEEFWALKDINFEINKGDRVGIIGRNGAGKSTLLKVLSRITEPTSGRIQINGRIASLLEVGTGFHPELTGRENIFLNGAILGMSRAEIRSKFDEIVAFAEVENFLDTPVKRYSSGMYVRLAFAVAAHLEPEVLVVDEVLAVGDAQFQKKCLGKMQDVSKNEGRTVLFVSHNMGVIAQLCQKAILMQKGQITLFDSTKSVIDRYISNSQLNSNVYLCDKADGDKRIFFDKIETVNLNGLNTDSFQFDESIFIRMILKVNYFDANAKISFTLQSNHSDYLSTFVEDLSVFYKEESLCKILIKLPPSLIAPNSYALRFAVFSLNGFVYDLIEMVCPFKVIETGSEMAIFEGMNYGHFFMNHEIVNI